MSLASEISLNFSSAFLSPGIHIRVIFARKFAERLADLFRRGRFLYPE